MDALKNNKFFEVNKTLALFSLISLAAFTFLSFSLSALFHIFILLPGFYFTFLSLKENNFDFLKTFSKSALSLLVFVILLLVSSVVNWSSFENPVKGLLSAKYFFLGFLAIKPFEYLFKNHFTPQKTKLVINIFIGATTLSSLSGLIAMPLGFNILRMKAACHTFRACGTYGMTITYGYGISMALILFATLYYQRKNLSHLFNKNLLWAALFINSLGLYFSYARGGLIAFFLGFCSLFYFKNKKIFLAVSSFFICLIIFLVLLSKYTKSTNHYIVPWEQPTNVLRLHQMKAATLASFENPIWGLGIRNFEFQSLELKERYKIPPILSYKDWKGHAHNNFLEILVGTGFFAFAFFLFWHVGWVIKSFKNQKYVFLFGPFIVVHLITGLFQSTIIDGENMFLIMGIFAISEALEYRQENT